MAPVGSGDAVEPQQVEHVFVVVIEIEQPDASDIDRKQFPFIRKTDDELENSE